MLKSKRVWIFPSTIQTVTLNRCSDEWNHGRRILFSGCFNLRRKHNLEAPALQAVKHCAFAYAVGMQWIHAAGKRSVLIDAAAIIP